MFGADFKVHINIVHSNSNSEKESNNI